MKTFKFADGIELIQIYLIGSIVFIFEKRKKVLNHFTLINNSLQTNLEGRNPGDFNALLLGIRILDYAATGGTGVLNQLI